MKGSLAATREKLGDGIRDLVHRGFEKDEAGSRRRACELRLGDIRLGRNPGVSMPGASAPSSVVD